MRTIKYVDGTINRIRFQSTKSLSIYEFVFSLTTNTWKCTCPDAIYRRNPKCKHIRAFMKGELDSPPEKIKRDRFLE